METGCGSKAANLEFKSIDSNGGTVKPLKNAPISKLNLPASACNNGGPELPKTSEGNAVVELGLASAGENEPRLDEMKANNPGTTSRRGCVSNDDSNPDIVELVSSSPESSNDETLLRNGSSNQELIQPTTPFSPLIMEPTQSFSLALAERIPQNGSYANQSSYSKHVGNSAQANKLNSRTESSLRAELAPPKRVESVDKGKKVVFAEDFGKNKHFNDNQPAPNVFPQTPRGIRILNGGSTQINQQQAPSLLSNKENNLHRPLAPGSQVNQLKATNISDPLSYNFMVPVCPTPSRNPMHLLNRVANMPNASGSLLQKSELTKHPLPMELMPHQFSYQYNQVPSALGACNSQTRSTMFHESSLPLSSHQATNQFSKVPGLPNQQHHNSELPETPLMPRLQTVQQQGLPSQAIRPNATYPSSGTSFPSLFLQETVGSSAPLHMGPLLGSHKEQGTAGLLGHARSRFEAAESSPFKRFRREATIPQASSAEQVNNNPLALLNGGRSDPEIASYILHPRPMINSLYDPIFEELGLPIDPHLRLFLLSKK